MKRSDPPRTQPWAAYVSHLGKYMRRWILRLYYRTMRLHNILESDEGRDFHDHPFDFLSIILKGGYIEHRPGCTCLEADGSITDGACRRFDAPAIVVRKATDFHRLELHRGSAWTLVFTSSYWREWGFLTPAGWIGYREYHRSYYQTPEAAP